MKSFKESLYDCYDEEINEESILHVEGKFHITSKNTVEDYLHGRCHIFAKVLNEITGFKMGLLIDSEAVTKKGFTLEHAYCYLNEEYVIDARGITTKKEMIDEYGWNALCLEEIEDAALVLQTWYKKGLLDKKEKNEYKEVREYIYLMQKHNILTLPPSLLEPLKNKPKI